jgi:hypothetical protein
VRADGQPNRLPNPQAVFPHNTYFGEKRPTGMFTRVYPNDYEPSRGLITVYNWDNKDSADVDISAISGLQPGDAYEVIDVQNLFGAPLVSGIYDGGKITVPLNNTVASQINGRPKHYAHTLKEFNCFLVRKAAAKM